MELARTRPSNPIHSTPLQSTPSPRPPEFRSARLCLLYDTFSSAPLTRPPGRTSRAPPLRARPSRMRVLTVRDKLSRCEKSRFFPTTHDDRGAHGDMLFILYIYFYEDGSNVYSYMCMILLSTFRIHLFLVTTIILDGWINKTGTFGVSRVFSLVLFVFHFSFFILQHSLFSIQEKNILLFRAARVLYLSRFTFFQDLRGERSQKMFCFGQHGGLG